MTRTDALAALADFVAHRRPEFGPYEDALVDGERVPAHSLLSVPLDLGLLTATLAARPADHGRADRGGGHGADAVALATFDRGQARYGLEVVRLE